MLQVNTDDSYHWYEFGTIQNQSKINKNNNKMGFMSNNKDSFKKNLKEKWDNYTKRHLIHGWKNEKWLHTKISISKLVNKYLYETPPETIQKVD